MSGIRPCNACGGTGLDGAGQDDCIDCVGTGKAMTDQEWERRLRAPHRAEGEGIVRRDPLDRLRTAYVVDDASGCWLWRRPLTWGGYGQYDEANTYRDSRGWRGCRACRTAAALKYRQRSAVA